MNAIGWCTDTWNPMTGCTPLRRRVREDVRHPRAAGGAAMRAHGTYVKYVIDRCRCPECRAANRAYEKQRTRDAAKRRWGALPPIFVDAAPVREHLFRLSAAGIGRKQVEILAGVGKTAQWKIRSRRVRKCLYATREAILAVGCDDHIFMRSHIDATRAREIVEELRGYGMAKAHIAKALGYASPLFRSLQRRPARCARCGGLRYCASWSSARLAKRGRRLWRDDARPKR